MDRRTVVLGIAAAGAVAAAIVVTLEGRGGGQSPSRKAVARYIQQVDEVQQQMQVPLTGVLTAYKDFANPRPGARDPRRELAQARRTLVRLRRRLAAIEPPLQAVHLRRLMLGLVDDEAAVTSEVEQMSVFTPRYQATLASLRVAGAQLGKHLAAIKAPKPHSLRGTRKQILKAQAAYTAAAARAAAAQADAVDVYDARVAQILRQLEALRPPAVLAPSYLAQIHAMRITRSAGARLSQELRKRDRSRVPIVGRAFTSASRISKSLLAQRSAIAAINAYNKRAREISSAAARVQVEVARLQRTVT
jgi:hypothetical protein